jgi:hypothetical protein
MATKRASAGKSAALTGHRGILTRVNREGWKALRLLSIERDTSLQALAIEAFNDLLAKHGKRPIVRAQTKDED